MEIYLKKPTGLNEPGAKGFNEDFAYPLLSQTNSQERIFFLCDGEGGPQAGEVASRQVALTMAKYIAGARDRGPLTRAFLEAGLQEAEQALSTYKEAHPESHLMGTTLALIHFGNEQVTLAWVGDTRIYFYDHDKQQLVPAEPENQVDAHALVRGADHPQQLRVKFIPLSQVGADDYFFMATKGIRSQMDERTLDTLFKPVQGATPEVLLEEISNLNKGFASDNYSCYLIQVERVEGQPEVSGAGTANTRTGYERQQTGEQQGQASAQPDPQPAPAGSGLLRNLIFGGVLLLLLGIIFLAWWSTRKTPYDTYMAQGDALLNEDKPAEAIAAFDSAYNQAPNEELQMTAARRKARALALLEMRADPLEGMTAAELVSYADTLFAQGAYADALDVYTRAEQALARDSTETATLPLARMAEAHLRLGNQAFEADSQDYAGALAQYEAGFRLYSQLGTTRSTNPLLDTARQRAQAAERFLAQAQTPPAQQPQGQQPQPLAQGTQNTRSLQPTGSQPTGTQPTTTGGQTREGSDPSTSNARLAGGDRFTQRSFTPEEETEMKRRMADGKRLYSKARANESLYEYRTSAENLEHAAPILDGPGSYMLAYIYHAGLSGQKDPEKALRYAQKSAYQAWAPGQYLYGHILLERRNRRDSITAREILQRAANDNFLEAIQRLQELNR